MIDCHFHLWATDHSTAAKRAERAEQITDEADSLGVDKVCLIGPYALGEEYENVHDSETAPPRESNNIVSKYVEEYPDRFHGWAQVDPRADDAVDEFRRTVEEEGLIGLKHHFLGSQVKLSDPLFDPIAEAAVDMDVPILEHVLHRLEPYPEQYPSESYTEDVAAIAERFPDLKVISAHIAGGGDWEYRIKNVAPYDNVYLDISGSVRDAGIIEMAAEHLGVERLVFGTDTWFVPGVGKLKGCALSPAEKAGIAYRLEELLPETVPNALGPKELEERRESSRDWFETEAAPVEPELTCVNGFVGEYAHREHDASAEDLLAVMDATGVDRTAVSAAEALMYRNVQPANERLATAVDGYENRLLPIATINPTYPAWETDLVTCIEEYGMRGVKILPVYHDYDLDHPAVEELFYECAERNLPVIVTAVLEDQRQRHPRVKLRGFSGMGRSKWWSGEQISALISTLRASPYTDVIIADTWAGASRIANAVTRINRTGVRLDNQVREGETLFALGDLNMYFTALGEDVVADVGVDHLVFGPKLPFKNFSAYYEYVEQLPVDEPDRDRIRHENVAALF